jgi:zinc protease
MELPETRTQVEVRPLAERVAVHHNGPVQLLMLEVPVPSVISFTGSFAVYSDLEAGEELLQDLTVSLLDKGTKRRDRFAIAELLDNRGAQLHFSSDTLRVRFSGRSLTEDIQDVMDVLAEQLREPLFDEAEFVKAKAQLAAKLHHALDSTGSQASGALTRRLYPKAHPNYIRQPEGELKFLAEISLADIRRFHERYFNPNKLTIAFAGDLDTAAVTGSTDELAAWSGAAEISSFGVYAEPQGVGETRIAMPDKTNIDVRIGHSLRLLRQDPDYVPLFVGNYILGGNFSARLMDIVRDQMGLTYGIRSALAGISTEYDGYFQVSVALSTDKLERGMEVTLAEIKRFAAEGVTEDELEEKKTTVTGSYKVGLATTGGLASALLHNAERGFGVDYLDRYPDEVAALTLEQVNGAIRRHIQPEQLQAAMAGTF